MSHRHICQVALCAHNAGKLREWYRVVFGLARGSGALVSFPPMPTRRIQGISPNPVETVTWLIDRQDYFQLEFFQFHRPQSSIRPADWRPCDIGYNLLGIHVDNFDQILHRYAAWSDRPAPLAIGKAGDRRACLRDPEGNWIEILERDPLAGIRDCNSGIVRPELGSTVRFMRISVPDLARARHTFVTALGLSEISDRTLHTPEHESLWDLPGAACETVLLGGENFLIELAAYQSHDPQPRPEGYQICDQGFMNVAVGFESADDFDRAFEQATAQGMRPNGKPLDIGIFRVMYINDPDGFSVEMLYARKYLWSLSGFVAGEPYVQNEIHITADREAVWERLTDHEGLGGWTVFDGRILRPGQHVTNGPGCLRELSGLGLRITEEIVDWDEGSHYAYRLRSGAPFRWHRGDIFLREDGGGVRVRWAVRFDSRLPFTGRLTAWILGQIFDRALQTLKHQLESQR